MSIFQLNVDPNLWIPTSMFKLMQFKYEKFNPLQSAFLNVYNYDANIVVESPTSSGKTVIAEIAICEALSRNKKAIYLSPFKALAQEKIDDWTDPAHFFSSKQIAIATGDYVIEDQREVVLRNAQKADIVIMTTELFDSLTRRPEKLKELFSSCGVLIVDESHLLSVPQRGSALEVSLMRFTLISESKIIFLSATMSNSVEIAEWLSKLNNKDTIVIKSTWRPCELDVHFIPYRDNVSWDNKKSNLIFEILKLIDKYDQDKFIVFVHSKSFGRELLKTLKIKGYDAEFHNADLSQEDRKKYIELFKKRGKEGVQVLVATSTIAWGCNLPARRVIIADVRRGQEDVPVHDILQMQGRAGRTGLDPKGDVYIIVPQKKYNYYKSIYKHLPPVQSCLINEDELAFHLINEINEGYNTEQALNDWFSRSFANVYFEKTKLNKTEYFTNTLISLTQYGAIKIVENTDGSIKFQTTPIGKIASWFYYPPSFVSQIYQGFKKGEKMLTDNDILLSWVIGKAYPFVHFSTDHLSFKEYQNELEKQLKFLNFWGINLGLMNKNLLAIPYAIYLILTEKANHVPEAYSLVKMIQNDSGRLIQMMKSLCQYYKEDLKYVDLYSLELRLKYGIRKDLVELCAIPNIGAIRARKLFEAGFKTIKDVYANLDKASKVAGVRILPEHIIQIYNNKLF